MRPITAFLLCLLMASEAALAQPQTYTILAQAGLNLRSGPGPQHPKILTLPFGTVVESALSETQLAYFEAIPPFGAEVIEGHRGFWMPARYRNHVGYIFSGFVLPDELVIPATEQNRDYRLLQTGYSCDLLNYDPQLHWYKMEAKGGVVQFVPTQVQLRLRQSFTLRDTAEYLWQGMRYQILYDGFGENRLLVGSRHPLPTQPDISQTPGKGSGDVWEPCFLDAGQSYTVDYKGGRYRFFAAPLPPGDSAPSPGNYRLKVGIRLPGQDKEQVLSLNKDLHLEESVEVYRRFRTPVLDWVGDINGDGYLDFIWYWQATLESCGGQDEHHLFLTDPTHPKRLIRVVAYESNSYCT